jgi:hypothetical protein
MAAVCKKEDIRGTIDWGTLLALEGVPVWMEWRNGHLKEEWPISKIETLHCSPAWQGHLVSSELWKLVQDKQRMQKNANVSHAMGSVFNAQNEEQLIEGWRPLCNCERCSVHKIAPRISNKFRIGSRHSFFWRIFSVHTLVYNKSHGRESKCHF